METVSLQEHFEKILAEIEKASNQRFRAQEAALEKAEANRDTAIKKAEDSIEKKSDAVYVKLTDLQKAFSDVMLRNEIEGRLQGMTKEVKRVSELVTLDQGKSTGLHQGWGILLGFFGLIGTIIGIVGGIAAIIT